ncbi:MAG: type II CAAX endopeptidase family protein [bacterium]|nr:type II CAAX endopeptidase family protein [bacterium]
MKSDTKTSVLIIRTIAAMVVIMAFYFVAGALVVTNQLEGATAKLVQGCMIWLSVLVAVVYAGIRQKSMKPMGFRPMKEDAAKKLYYYLPVIIVALSGFIAGIDLSGDGWKYIAASLFLTIAVGFSEEIYFRGIICEMWKEKSTTISVFVSSVLFGVCHLMNVLGGADLKNTILQIFFAFFYGIVFAQIYIISNSILPCVILHFLHDFCSFTGASLNPTMNTVLAAVQTVILIVYGWMLWKQTKKEGRQTDV